MTKIILFGDNDTTGDAVKILDAIKKEQNVDQYVFLGDGPYASSGTKWVEMIRNHIFLLLKRCSRCKLSWTQSQ